MLLIGIPLTLGLIPYLSVTAYVGPGAGLTMLSALLAVVLVLLLALLAPFLYLVRLTRTLLGGRRSDSELPLDAQTAHASDEGQMDCS